MSSFLLQTVGPADGAHGQFFNVLDAITTE
jgi:hypothetical protein